MVFRHRNGFRVVRVFFGIPRGYRNPPGKYWAYMGHRGERGEPARGGTPPPQKGVRIVQGGGGRAPFPLSNSDSPWGARATPCRLPSLSPMAHVGPLLPRGVPVTPRYSEKYPNHSETIPVSEYHHPIYQSLPLYHFETPHHVRDLIRDSEQSSVTKNT